MSYDNYTIWLDELNHTWHSTIPLSKAMQICAHSYDGDQLNTSADKAFSQNLHNTMFAGSIYTLATLTGWGWVWLQLRQQGLDGDIVLADAQIKYLKPITQEPRAQSSTSDNHADFTPLLKGNNGQAQVQVTLQQGNKAAAVFTGRYVVLTKKGRQQ